MPQIGWFEILIIVILAVLIIGPKDFPVVLRKVGNWIGSIKKYFNEIQKNISETESSLDLENEVEEKYSIKNKDKKKDE
tara:strand:- start:319 stop:555 length:237 start_codon:yes stop_codon:yes gene_type:complete